MKKTLLMMAAALTAWSASAQLYVTGANVAGASGQWNPGDPLEVAAENGEYTFEATGEFKISIAKGTWNDFNGGAYMLDGVWTTTDNTATANLKQGDANITPAKAGVAITYVVKDDLSAITAQLPSGPVTLNFYVTGGFADWDSAPADYKMTSKGNNVYSYTAVSELPLGDIEAGAGFKITDGTSWYGTTDTPAYNTTLNASTAAQGNFEISVPAGGEIIFTYVEGGQSTVYIKTNGEEPPVPVQTPDHLYLVGDLAGNAWTPATAPELTKEGTVFSISNVEMGTTGNFSFLTSNGETAWGDLRYGAATDGENLVFTDNEATLNLISKTGDVGAIVAGPGKFDMTVTFTTSGAVLKVTKAGEVVVVEDLVLVGSFNDWAENDPAFQMTKNGDTYTYTMAAVEAGAEFKIKTAEEGWTTSWGAEGDPSWTEAQPVAVTPNVAINAWPGSGCNFMFENALSNVTFTFVRSNDPAVASTLTVAGTSAIEEVEAAATDAPAEYYNLQGIRVLAPEAGQLYIVNRAGKVSKEIAR